MKNNYYCFVGHRGNEENKKVYRGKKEKEQTVITKNPWVVSLRKGKGPVRACGDLTWPLGGWALALRLGGGTKLKLRGYVAASGRQWNCLRTAVPLQDSSTL